MTSSTESAVGIDDQLRALLARGFQFVHPTGRSGELVAIVGVRVHHEMTDVVCLRGEGEAKAARMPCDEADIFAPKRIVWQTTGGADTVLTGLLALPDDYPAAASTCRGAGAALDADPSGAARLARVS